MYNSATNSILLVDFNFTVIKNTADSGLLPKFISPSSQVDPIKHIYRIKDIKMFGAAFN
jgi:hypothetical protein